MLPWALTALFSTQHAPSSSRLTKHTLQHSATLFCAMAQFANAQGQILAPAVIVRARSRKLGEAILDLH